MTVLRNSGQVTAPWALDAKVTLYFFCVFFFSLNGWSDLVLCDWSMNKGCTLTHINTETLLGSLLELGGRHTHQEAAMAAFSGGITVVTLWGVFYTAWES